MYGAFKNHLEKELAGIREAGFYKSERVITTPQNAEVGVAGSDRKLLNFCANNYLGLAQDPGVRAAAQAGLEQWGYGVASVRFICGTQRVHKQLEEQLTAFLGTEDTILYPSCFDANTGLFETLFTESDAIISDELNHASIIDGIRLCKAKRYRFRNSDMSDLETQLDEANKAGARFKIISTDGVFSMDGTIAQVDRICDLAESCNAMVHVDDSHATGIVGNTGRGTHEFRKCMGRVDIITGTLGKALGGASGGFTSGRKEIVELLRQRSRPYLFSNSVAPSVVAGAQKALQLAEAGAGLRKRLYENVAQFRAGMAEARFEVLPGEHPIIPVMVHDATQAGRLAAALLEEGVYVIAFSYPVVPKGKARIRVQISAAHTPEEIEFAVEAFIRARDNL
ncbi:MAG: glycine C-acetyltransferase [Gammaproteobacteria bacterium]|nr:glycine C-acetyltransferase [Gammaproteobacteria bacterium]